METVQKNFGEISENTLLILLFLIGTVISILDCLTTYIILQLGGIEFNPIITPILGNIGLLFIIKMIALCGIIYVIRFATFYTPSRTLYIIPLLPWLAAVLWNIVEIIRFL